MLEDEDESNIIVGIINSKLLMKYFIFIGSTLKILAVISLHLFISEILRSMLHVEMQKIGKPSLFKLFKI